jgi:hypothetical protein
MPIVLDLDTLERIANLSNPHMKAMNEAITAAYPDNPDGMYTLAFAFQLGVVLQTMGPEVRPAVADLINHLLAKSHIGYKLVPTA